MMKSVKENSSKLAKVLFYYGLIDDVSLLKQKIVCPFHEDANPSLLCNLDTDSWYCFGCNKAGDAKRFVELVEKKYYSKNDIDAFKTYVDILKSDKVQHISVRNVSSKARKQQSKELYDIAWDYYYGLRTIDWMQPEEQEAIDALEYMSKRGFSAKALNKAKAKVTYNNSYGIIFPMLDNGEFKGWVCRTMKKEVEQYRKYLYNKGFSRVTTLVGDYGSKDYIFVVEGYMDRLKFIQFGINNVVAILGWKMSNQQIEKLKAKGIKKVICALDNDDCGRRGYRYLQNFFKVTRFCYLKGVKDPGDMSEESFKKMYRRTMHAFKNN